MTHADDRYDAYVDTLIDDAARNGFGGEPEQTDEDAPWLPYPEYVAREFERLVIAESASGVDVGEEWRAKQP